MKYIIGMDGGGTKTHCIITNIAGEILYECNGGASNFLVQGTSPVSNTLLNLIENCTNHLQINISDIQSVLLGTTGAGRRVDAEKLENDFNTFLKSKDIHLNNFRVESDARVALEGAFSGNPGSILIAGTGSIMFGKDSKGNIYRVGGFGRFLGDEGSGFVIGRKGLVAVSKAFDGRGEETLLTKLAYEKFNIDSPEVLITEIYKNNFDIASAARIVIEAADEGDKAALNIIEVESDELALHIKAMKNKINEPVLNVSFIGGIISNENIYSKMLRSKIKKYIQNVVVKQPDYSPAYGAVIMARALAN